MEAIASQSCERVQQAIKEDPYRSLVSFFRKFVKRRSNTHRVPKIRTGIQVYFNFRQEIGPLVIEEGRSGSRFERRGEDRDRNIGRY